MDQPLQRVLTALMLLPSAVVCAPSHHVLMVGGGSNRACCGVFEVVTASIPVPVVYGWDPNRDPACASSFCISRS